MTKRLLVSINFMLLQFLSLYAEPSGRGYDPNAPDIGLPSGNEVLTGLIIAIIEIQIRYLILNANKKENSSEESLFPGCLGVLCIGGGLVCLLPLLAWIFSFLSAIFAIGVVVVIIRGVLALFFSKK